MNAILPLLIFTVLLMIPQDVAVGRLVISEVGDGTAAAEAQVKPGDIVLQANGRDIDNRLDFTREINLNGGSQMRMLVERDGQELMLMVRPRFDTEAARWLVGVIPRLEDFRIERQSQPISNPSAVLQGSFRDVASRVAYRLLHACGRRHAEPGAPHV